MQKVKPSQSAPKAVLVIESNPDDISLIQHAARRVCPDVPFHFVTDGYQALAYLKGESPFTDRQAHPFPGVLLLNLTLRGMDSFQLLDHIHCLAECESVQVLGWTDGPDAALGVRAQRAGVHHFMRKPFSFDQLMQEVNQICERTRSNGGE